MNHDDCPVCRGKVTKENVTPIYGAGDEEKDPRKTEKHDRPKAHYEESDHSVPPHSSSQRRRETHVIHSTSLGFLDLGFPASSV